MHLKDTVALTNGVAVPQPAPGRLASAFQQDDAISSQAKEIIEDVLDPGSGCEEEIRQGLRRHVAARPGRPDLALLEHVLAVRGHASSVR